MAGRFSLWRYHKGIFLFRQEYSRATIPPSNNNYPTLLDSTTQRLYSMSHKIHVSFIGAGEIGQAISQLTSHSGVHVERWDADPKKVPDQKSLKEVVESADVLFLCVPSWVLRKAIKPTIPFLSKKTLCVFVSKGIEEKTHLFIDQLAKKILPKNQPIAFLSGPMLAEELIAGKSGAALVASQNRKTFVTLQSIFSCSDLRLEYTNDVRSVSVSGVLKNIYAISLGIAAGLNWGDNRKGWLCAAALSEMSLILKMQKTNPSFAYRQSGLADLIATGFSKYSSNQTLGRELVEKSQCERKSEGCISLPSLVKQLGVKRMKKLPILSSLNRIISKGKNAKNEFETLFCG